MEFLTVLDAARLLDRSPESVRVYEKAGKLRAIRTKSGIRLFRRQEVERFLAERTKHQSRKLSERLDQVPA